MSSLYMRTSHHYTRLVLKSSGIFILLSLVLLDLTRSAGSVYPHLFGHAYVASQMGSAIFFDVMAIIFFLIVPLIMNQFFYHEKLIDLGFTLPQGKLKTFFSIAIALCILLPVIFYAVQFKTIQSYYYLGNQSSLKIAFIIGVLFPVYYLAEEFFFRGFMFFILWRKIGWHSFWITEVIFTYAHFGKPMFEILLSLPAGFILNLLSLNTKSFYPCVLVHYIMGVTLLVLVNYF